MISLRSSLPGILLCSLLAITSAFYAPPHASRYRGGYPNHHMGGGLFGPSAFSPNSGYYTPSSFPPSYGGWPSYHPWGQGSSMWMQGRDDFMDDMYERRGHPWM